MATLHFEKRDQIESDLLKKVFWYFDKIGPIVDAFRNKLRSKKRRVIEDKIFSFLKEPDLENFYIKLIGISKTVFNNCECSVFLRERANTKNVKLVATSSDLIKTKKGTVVYNLNSKEKSEVGITGKVLLENDYKTIFYRNNDDYSGGRCDELKTDGQVSMIFGRIVVGKLNVGVIRGVNENKYHRIDDINYTFQAFDKDDEKLMQYLSFLASMVVKLLLYSEEEKEKIQELEHETITPISIVIHEIDDLLIKINDFRTINSKELLYLIDRKNHHDLNLPIWNDDAKKSFDFWAYRLQIAKFEAQLTSNLLRSPNAVDIPIQKYNFETIKLYSLIIPNFHHADYLANIKGKNLGLFKQTLKRIKRENFSVKVDQIMFGHAFLHIVDNAIKYVENTQELKKDVWFEVVFIGSKKFKKFKLSICNFGQRIPEKEYESIFKKNISGEYAKKKKLAGKGLGLFVAKTIMENLGGTVGINKGREDCIEFFLTIPVF